MLFFGDSLSCFELMLVFVEACPTLGHPLSFAFEQEVLLRRERLLRRQSEYPGWRNGSQLLLPKVLGVESKHLIELVLPLRKIVSSTIFLVS